MFNLEFKSMKAKKQFKVVAHVDYGHDYCVGRFNTKREANACLKRQYTTVSRTFTIEEELVPVV